MLVSSSRQREARGNKVASVYGRVSVAERGREGTVNGRIMSRVCPQSQRVDKPRKPFDSAAPVPNLADWTASRVTGSDLFPAFQHRLYLPHTQRTRPGNLSLTVQFAAHKHKSWYGLLLHTNTCLGMVSYCRQALVLVWTLADTK